MKTLPTGLLALAFCFVGGHILLAAPVSNSIQTIRAVGKEGQGNAAAAKAWQRLTKAEASALPKILAAMDGQTRWLPTGCARRWTPLPPGKANFR